MIVSRSEYPRDKPFLLTMVSYSRNKQEYEYKREKNLSDLPANCQA